MGNTCAADLETMFWDAPLHINMQNTSENVLWTCYPLEAFSYSPTGLSIKPKAPRQYQGAQVSTMTRPSGSPQGWLSQGAFPTIQDHEGEWYTPLLCLQRRVVLFPNTTRKQDRVLNWSLFSVLHTQGLAYKGACSHSAALKGEDSPSSYTLSFHTLKPLSVCPAAVQPHCTYF